MSKNPVQETRVGSPSSRYFLTGREKAWVRTYQPFVVRRRGVSLYDTRIEDTRIEELVSKVDVLRPGLR